MKLRLRQTLPTGSLRFTDCPHSSSWFLTKGKTFSQSAAVLKCPSTEIKSSKEPLSVLMLCMSSNCWWPFLYHTKMADLEYFHVFVFCFLVKFFGINSEKCIEYGK